MARGYSWATVHVLERVNTTERLTACVLYYQMYAYIMIIIHIYL